MESIKLKTVPDDMTMLFDRLNKINKGSVIVRVEKLLLWKLLQDHMVMYTFLLDRNDVTIKEGK